MGNDNPNGVNWWRVDIGLLIHVKYVVVTNRGDFPAFCKCLRFVLISVLVFFR